MLLLLDRLGPIGAEALTLTRREYINIYTVCTERVFLVTVELFAHAVTVAMGRAFLISR